MYIYRQIWARETKIGRFLAILGSFGQDGTKEGWKNAFFWLSLSFWAKMAKIEQNRSFLSLAG